AEKMAEDILAIADEECTTVRASKHGMDGGADGMQEVVFDATAVARNRLRVDARKWLASKLAPKKYGDKVLNEVTGANGGAIAQSITVSFVAAQKPGDDE
ncbi:MAG: terminase small subunit protein, partial [Desulfurellales bacterium]